MQLELTGQTWTIVGPLDGDRGGFGDVYEIESEAGEEAVAKSVRKVAGATRELLIGDSVRAAGYRHVIPILDSGEHNDCWILVMPRADYSLAQYLAGKGSPLDLAETVNILTDVATALAEIDGTVVHRDIKPANILFHDGVWKLADFGIARYSAATTSDETRKFSFSAAYAAPEQWEHRHATGATDVYAFGVLAYLLLSGGLPFCGPDHADFRDQHLAEAPLALSAGSARLRMLVEECLYKEPGVRPQARSLLARLEGAEKEDSRPGVSKLAEVSRGHIQERARQQIVLTIEHERRERLKRRFAAAAQAFESIVVPLKQDIQDNAPTAVFQDFVGNDAPRFRVDLGDAAFTLGRARGVEYWDGPFEVIAYADVTVTQWRSVGGTWVGRGHSLWFCDARDVGQFGWFELAFINSAFSGTRPSVEPYACSPAESEYALSNVVGTKQVAWPVTEIDRADPGEFIERWLGWFADAASSELHRPSQLPEIPCDGTWRR